MKKAAVWLAVVSAIVFVIAWGVGGVLILDGEYGRDGWMYIGLAAAVILVISLNCMRVTRCPHCSRICHNTPGEYCPYCGNKVR